MSKHVHAELMLQYAQESFETDKPWERWELAKDGEEWHTPIGELSFLSELRYRRKQKTININGFEVPEPLREAPKKGTKCYIANVSFTALIDSLWNGDIFHRYYLNAGLIHLTEKAADLHRAALLSFMETKNENQ